MSPEWFFGLATLVSVSTIALLSNERKKCKARVKELEAIDRIIVATQQSLDTAPVDLSNAADELAAAARHIQSALKD